MYLFEKIPKFPERLQDLGGITTLNASFIPGYIGHGIAGLGPGLIKSNSKPECLGTAS